MNREIITLQLGHYSNFVGTHWWNLQEASFVYDQGTPTDLNHDILYREGQTLQGEVTFLPRLVAVDLNGSLNTLRQNGGLYANQKKSSEIPWAGEIVVHKTEPIQKNEFLQDLENEELERNSRVEAGSDSRPEKDICHTSLTNEQDDKAVEQRTYNLEDDVSVWSDFLRGHFHPKSIFLVEQFNHGNELDTFNAYGLGQQVWAQEKTSETLEDKIRFFCEECDHLQGFHVVLDAYDGFAGIGHGIVSLLRDEYSSKSVLSIPTFPTHFLNDELQDKNYRQCNITFLLQFLASNSSVVIPLSLASSFASKETTCREFPYLTYNTDLMYHTSAILAVALETSSTLYRVKKDPVLLADLAASLSPVGLKIAAQSLMLPFPLQCDSVSSSLHKFKPVFESLTPGVSFKDSPSILQSIVGRGLNNVQLYSNDVSRNRPHKCNTLEEMLGTYLSNSHSSSCSLMKTAHEACATTAPFPNMFSPNISSNGFVIDEPRDLNIVESVPVLGGLHCNQGVHNTLQEVCTGIRKLNLKKLHSFFTSGVEVDDFKDAIETLEAIASAYGSEFS